MPTDELRADAVTSAIFDAVPLPHDWTEGRLREVVAKALASPSPDAGDRIMLVENEAANERWYTHAPCDSATGSTRWLVPHDGCERPAHVECPECARWLPVDAGDPLVDPFAIDNATEIVREHLMMASRSGIGPREENVRAALLRALPLLLPVALAAHRPGPGLREALRERAHCAYHEHRERGGPPNVGDLTAFIADRLAEVVEAGPPYDGQCDGCRELGLGPWRGVTDEGGEG